MPRHFIATRLTVVKQMCKCTSSSRSKRAQLHKAGGMMHSCNIICCSGQESTYNTEQSSHVAAVHNHDKHTC